MATRNQSDSIRQELNGTWQQISGSFNFSYTSIAGFPRLLLHHDGSLYVLASAGAILWLKPEYQINGGAWTDSGWGPDGGKRTFPAGWDGTISLHCNRPCFPTAYPAGTVINTRVMAKCSGSVVLCDSLLVPQAEAVKTWMQSDSHQWNEAEDDTILTPDIAFQPLSKVFIPRISGNTLGYQDVKYGSGYFIAVASVLSGGNFLSKAFRSSDTINWSEINVPADKSLSRIVHGDGVFIISSTTQNLIWRSADAGENWTQIILPKPEWFPITASLNKVAYGLSMFVGVASNGALPDQLFKSSDLGLTWQTVNVPNNRWNTVAFGNGVFVALGNNSVTGQTLVYNGSGVTVHNNISYAYKDIAFGGTQFVAVRSGNEFIKSSDNGTTWTAFTVPLSRQWSHIIYDNGLFVVTAYDGLQDCMMTSPDAVVWTVIDRPAMINSYLSSVAGNNAGLMVAVSSSAGADLPRAFITFDQDQIPVLSGQANVTVAKGDITYFKVSVPSNISQVVITLESITTDLGLYVGIGYLPNTYGMNDYSSAKGMPTEQVTITNTGDTLYAIGILGYEAGSGVLKIALS